MYVVFFTYSYRAQIFPCLLQTRDGEGFTVSTLQALFSIVTHFFYSALSFFFHEKNNISGPPDSLIWKAERINIVLWMLIVFIVIDKKQKSWYKMIIADFL